MTSSDLKTSSFSFCVTGWGVEAQAMMIIINEIRIKSDRTRLIILDSFSNEYFFRSNDLDSNIFLSNTNIFTLLSGKFNERSFNKTKTAHRTDNRTGF